jgi:acetyl-CoA C-acetyltransferase
MVAQPSGGPKNPAARRAQGYFSHGIGTTAIRATLDRAKLPAENIYTDVMGNVVQAGNKMNPARQDAINGDAPVDVQFSR